MSSEKKYLEINHQMVTWSERAVIETFNSLFSCAIKLRDVKIELNPLKGLEVSGVLALGQSSLEGVMAVSFPRDTLTNITSHVYKVDRANLTDELIIGAVSELTSIIFSLLKEKYNQNGFQFTTAFPIVVTGEGHVIFSTFPTNKMQLSFDSTYGPFTFEIAAAQGK